MNPIPCTCASWLPLLCVISTVLLLVVTLVLRMVIDLIWLQMYFVLFYKMYKLNASNYWFGELNFASSCSLLKVVTINQALNHSQRGSRSDRLKCYGTAASYFIFWHRHFFFNCQLNYAAAGLWGVSNYLLILKMVSLFVDTDWLIIVLVWLHCALRNCSKQVNHPVCLKGLCVNRSDVFSNKHWTDWVGPTWLWYVVPTPHPQWKYKDKGCVKRELITCKWNYLVFNLWRPPPPPKKKS